MKIEIDIPRKTYEHIRADGGHGYFNIYDEDNRIVTKAVFDGKKLPEHHGRLIDEQQIIDRFKPVEKFKDWRIGLDGLFNVLSDAPTIIEGSGFRVTNEEAIKQLKKCKSFHNGSYGTAIDMAIKALEQINCLTDRPCEVCEYHSENGCSRWKCIFEEVTK